MTNRRTGSEIVREIAQWAHSNMIELLIVIPHESRAGESDSATVVRSVPTGSHPLVVHTATLAPGSKDGEIAVWFDRGDSFNLNQKHTAMARAVERATGCSV